jgi:DNA (cytosine-5)-methyltransferase 1
VSLYAGAGGMDIGFAAAGFEPVWSNELDPAAVDTYTAALGGHEITCGDIRDQDLPARGSADVVIGGPPCQGFSVAGKMNPEDPRSHHVWEFLRVVEHVRPAAFVLENVKNLAVNRRWQGLRDQLLTRATLLGYETHVHLLNAADFGVPQARERMFMIGIAGGGQIEFTPQIRPPRTVREALSALPAFGQPGNDSYCTARIVPAKNPVLRRSPYAGMLFNGQGRPLDPSRPALTLPASMSGNRTPIIEESKLLDASAPSWIESYHADLWSGGDPAAKVPADLRRITIEEAAALQTFPTGMVFAGSQSAQYRQIGNAVPPVLAEAVARGLKQGLVAGADTAASLVA